MTHPAFDTLLTAARQAHVQHPQLSAFCPFPDDLTPNPIDPYPIAAARLMAADATLAAAATHPLASAFIAAGPHALWRETYKGTGIGQDFLDRFGCYGLIGPGGPWQSTQMQAFVVYMPAGLHYPWHEHPAEELYFVIAGEAEFHRDGDPPETLRQGQSAFHAGGQPHAMQTGDHPVMAYVLWRSHFDTAPVLSKREAIA